MKLKEDFPSFAALDAAGEATKAKIRKRIAAGTLTEIDGIGPAAAAKIEAEFESMDSPANQAKDGQSDEGLDTSHEAAVAAAAASQDRDGTGPTDAPTAPEGSKAGALTGREVDAPSATEQEAREDATNPGQKQAKDESLGEKLAHSRFCSYDDPDGPFIGNADEVTKRKQSIKVLPIALVTPSKGMEIRDGGDCYQITEEMAGENPSDWLKVRSPKTGLPLIR